VAHEKTSGEADNLPENIGILKALKHRGGETDRNVARRSAGGGIYGLIR